MTEQFCQTKQKFSKIIPPATIRKAAIIRKWCRKFPICKSQCAQCSSSCYIHFILPVIFFDNPLLSKSIYSLGRWIKLPSIVLIRSDYTFEMMKSGDVVKALAFSWNRQLYIAPYEYGNCALENFSMLNSVQQNI